MIDLSVLSNEFHENGFDFRRVSQADMTIIKIWLSEPHIEDWWTPSPEMMEEMAQKNSHQDTAIARYIVSNKGRDFAYIQCYDPSQDLDYWQDNPQTEGTVGLDQFVGDSEMLGFGHGTNFIKAFIQNLERTSSIKRVIVDPAPDNLPAIRCYEQVGFRKEKEITTPDGPAILMAKAI